MKRRGASGAVGFGFLGLIVAAIVSSALDLGYRENFWVVVLCVGIGAAIGTTYDPAP